MASLSTFSAAAVAKAPVAGARRALVAPSAAIRAAGKAASSPVSRPGAATVTREAAKARQARAVRCRASGPEMKALIFDCDGVILESEELHRVAYNAAFAHFNVTIGGQTVEWSPKYYDMLSNTVGGGKAKMRWYFQGNHPAAKSSFEGAGWPESSVLGGRAPTSDDEKTELIDVLQDWKSLHYQELLGSGQVPPRPGVLRLMDEAFAHPTLKVAVCSAATKSSCVATVNALLGPDRVAKLDCFMAGDDVPRKKPDPIIYQLAAEKLGVDPTECLVVEDSMVGMTAAKAAGMRCMVTYTLGTEAEEFPGAERIVGSLGGDGCPEGRPAVRLGELMFATERLDDRAVRV